MNKDGNMAGRKTCCEKWFHTVPTFTYMGTCFTTKEIIYEVVPSIFSSITLWLDGLNSSRVLSKFFLFVLGHPVHEIRIKKGLL